MGKWKMVGFDTAFEDVTRFGTKIKQEDYLPTGLYPVVDRGKEPIAGYTNLTHGIYSNVPAVIFGGHTRIIKYIETPIFLGADGVKLLHLKSEKYHPKYMYYCLLYAKIPNTGYNRHFKWLKELTFPIPPLDVQQKIANVLDKASALIDLRRAQLDKLDLLIKSQFVEMFGDPVTNPMGWQQMTFKQASIRLSDGPFGSNLKSEHYAPSGVRVIRLQNIGIGVFIDDDKAFVPQTHYEKIKKYTCKSGEIVIGTLGEPNLRACIIPESIDVAINKADCVHYIPKPELLTNEFVCQYINCPATLTLASGMIHGQTRARVSSGQIAEMPLYIPPLELQNEFADFVSQVENQKKLLQQSLFQLELNYKSLMQKCFRGEVF